MEKTYAEIVNDKRNLEKEKLNNIVNQFAKKGYYLEDLGEERYHNRYRLTNMHSYEGKFILSTNHAKDLEQLEKVLKLLKFNARTLPYETKLIELNCKGALDKEYSDLMTEMESKFNIPSFDDPEWNERNKDVVYLYRTIGNQRNLEEEQEDDWELEL